MQLQNRQFRMLHQSVINFPIPKTETEKMHLLSNLSEQVAFNKRHGINTAKTEDEINELILSIYELNQSEINFIKLGM